MWGGSTKYIQPKRTSWDRAVPKAVFGMTSLRFICMSDILAMVWYIWFKNHIENIEHFKNEDYLNLKNESDLTNEDDYKTEDDLKKKDVHK